MIHQSFRALAPALLLTAVAGCSDGTEGGRPMGDATLTRLSLTSDAFQDGQAIPQQHTCDGADQSPPLQWGDPPEGTRSFALIVDDPDAPSGTFRHWGAYDIPANLRSLPAGAGNSQNGAFAQAVNDFGRTGYGGPCPPKGHGPHHYRFKLLALSVDKLGVPANPKIADVEREAEKRLVGRGELTGTYERK